MPYGALCCNPAMRKAERDALAQKHGLRNESSCCSHAWCDSCYLGQELRHIEDTKYSASAPGAVRGGAPVGAPKY